MTKFRIFSLFAGTIASLVAVAIGIMALPQQGNALSLVAALVAVAAGILGILCCAVSALLLVGTRDQ